MNKDEEELYIRTTIEAAKALDPKLKYLLVANKSHINMYVMDLVRKTLREQGIHITVITVQDPNAIKLFKLVPEDPV